MEDILECPKCGNESLVKPVLPEAPWACPCGHTEPDGGTGTAVWINVPLDKG